MKFVYHKLVLFIMAVAFAGMARANYVFIPMDNTQTDHLKAYGVAYKVLELNDEIFWMLNYRGGAFMFKYRSEYEDLMLARNVSYELITDGQSTNLITQLSDPDVNMNPMKLEKAPKIAVYSPPGMQPWDDAVTMVLTYSQIPYDTIYDTEVINGLLPTYNWLHLHHEDFTGQYGKFWSAYKNANWYQEQVRSSEALAKRLGFNKVSDLKLGVAKKIRDYVAGGGYLFAMCSATDSYDIALASEGIDICETPFDGDPMDPQAQSKLDYSKCFAFKDFVISTNAAEYEYSNIDMTTQRMMQQKMDFFTLFEFSAKSDEVPTMLTQNHEGVIKGFMGQTTAFKKNLLKSNVVILGDNKQANEVRYIHGTFGKGFWTFYGGHDPEDYQHKVGDEPTDLSLHPNSSGYRLILNNVLFPAAKKEGAEDVVGHMISSDQNSALIKIYNASLQNVDWKNFSNYCLKRESGLRKEAFEELDIFLQNCKNWNNREQIDFIKFLFPFFENIESADYVAFPEPMKNFIQPILKDWCNTEEVNGNPFRWYGKYFQSENHLLKAIKLNSADDLARITLINWWTYNIYYSVHHLPNGYIGEPDKDLELGEKIQDQINLLSTKEGRNYWTKELEEDLELVKNYIDWEKSGESNFESWGKKNNRKVGY